MGYRQGVVLVVAAAVLWSLLGLAIRLMGDAGTWQVLFWRSLGLVPVLFAVLHRRSGGHPLARIRAAGLPGLAGGTGLVFAFAGAIYAIQATTVANAVFLFAAAPLITAVLAWLVLKEPVRPATWIAIAIAALGMFVMVREGLAIGAGAGNVAALLSAAGFAAFTVTLRWGRLSDMLAAVLIGGVMSILIASLAIWLRGESFGLPLRSALIAMAMGAVLLGGGMAIYTAGSRAVPAAEIGILAMAEVMLSPVWVWLVLGEWASAATFAGGSILMVAIAFNALSGMRHRPSLTPG
ncbi:MAG: DMT family transporter [Defluviimonas sp.]|nr:DMT family transporter [Paracoccaceae bacterium]MCC0062590.1 DMT family transporter [Defluviimonas sp.]